MSNLSDLMPAGASGKTIEATATATIASKAPVILNSTGTVTEVGLTTDSAGTPAVYQTNGLTWNQAAFDSSTNKVVISYNQGGTGAKAAVGTISGSTITYGTPVAISGAGNSYGSITYDSNTNRVVIAYRDYSNSDYGTAVVGAVSGTSISFGTPVVFESASAPYIGTTFDTNNNAVAISYADGGNSNYGTAVVGTVTGGVTNSISFGTPVVFNSGATAWTAATFDTSYNRVVIAYMDDTNADYGTVILGSISGSVITFGGSEIVFGAHQTSHIAIAYDSTLEKVVIAYNNIYPDGLGTAIVGTGTGSYTMTFGTPVVFEPSGNDSFYMTATFDSNANKVVIAYQDVANSSYGTVIVGTVSGTTISFDTAVVFEAATTTYIGCAYDSNAAKVAIVYSDGGNSDYGTGVVFSVGGTNVTASNFVGIADAGIATSATGTIVVQGGTVSMVADTTYTVTVGGGKFLIDGVSQATLNLYEGSTYKFDQAAGTNSTHPLRFSAVSDGTHGSPASQVFTSESSLNTPCITYDTTNDKIVIAYRYWSGSANVGAVIVGTLSGNSITYGTPVVMPTSAVPTYTSIIYDSNANRVVISYRDADNSDYGTSVVVTISGTTPSFGTPVVFESANAQYIATTFDSDSNKVVIAYQDAGNSSYGTAIVGTVSGTSISFGTAVVYAAASTEYIGCTFDSSNNKTVIAYKKNDGTGYGTGIVGTVSGTSISFGTPATFQSNPSNEIYATFDSTANKTVFVYQTNAVGSDYGTAVVGTVSGTGISFGTAATFNSATTNNMGLAYDATADTTTIAFKKAATGYGTKLEATISGTSISFGADVVFEAATTTSPHLVYDPDQGKIVISYLATTGKTIVYPVSEYTTGVTTNGTPGSAGAYTQIAVASGAPTLYYYCSNHSGMGGTANTPSFVTGSSYYVQDDGTITTVSSSVKAGLATSTTQLLLNGDS